MSLAADSPVSRRRWRDAKREVPRRHGDGGLHTLIGAAGTQGARLAHAARLLSGLVHARSVCTPTRGRTPSVFGRSVWFNGDGQDSPEAAGAALAA